MCEAWEVKILRLFILKTGISSSNTEPNQLDYQILSRLDSPS